MSCSCRSSSYFTFRMPTVHTVIKLPALYTARATNSRVVGVKIQSLGLGESREVRLERLINHAAKVDLIVQSQEIT